MMSCDKFKTLLYDYVDQALSAEDAEAVDKHCSSCESCTHDIQSIRTQRQLLQSLPVPAASEDFKQRAIRSAVQGSGQETGKNQGYFYKFAAAAMVSAFVLWLGMLNVTQKDKGSPVFVMVSDQARDISVAIDSEQDLDVVEMYVEISDNLELKGLGNKKQVNWTTGLQKGVNVISLPVVGIAKGDGAITTRVQLKGKEKVMHIKTRYKGPGNVFYNLDSMKQG
jgi:Putative zinc-finger